MQESKIAEPLLKHILKICIVTTWMNFRNTVPKRERTKPCAVQSRRCLSMETASSSAVVRGRKRNQLKGGGGDGKIIDAGSEGRDLSPFTVIWSSSLRALHIHGKEFPCSQGSEVLPRDVHSAPCAPLSGKAAHLVRGGAGEGRRRMQHRGDTDLWRGTWELPRVFSVS